MTYSALKKADSALVLVVSGGMLLSLAPVFVFAQTNVQVGGSVDVGTEIDAKTLEQMKSGATGQVQVNVGSSDAGVKTKTSAKTGVSVQKGAQAGGAVDIGTEIHVKVLEKLKETKSLSATVEDLDLDASAEQSIADLDGDEGAYISSDNDVEAYGRLIAKTHPVVTEVDAASDGEVTVAYKQPGKLFGLVPMTMTARVLVTPSGNVQIKLPWYGILMVKNTAEVKASVEQRLKGAQAENTVAFEAQAATHPVQRARIVHIISSTLADEIVVNADGSVSLKSVEGAVNVGADGSVEASQ